MQIFENVNIENINVKNRIFRSATNEALGDKEGNPQENLIRMYERLAKNEVGLIITGFMAVSEDGKSDMPNMLTMDNDNQIENFKIMTERIHKLNTPIVAQLVHCGSNGIGGKKFDVNRISESKINEIIDEFVSSMVRAKNAEFDGVELHIAHGYFLNQMVSPYTNKRKDKWGGSTENRFRIVKEILNKFRKIDRDYPVFAKINIDDNEKNGIHINEAIKIGKLLEENGVNAIDVSRGISFNRSMGPLYGKVPTEMILNNYPIFKDKPNFFKNIMKPVLPIVMKNKKASRMYNFKRST